MKQKFLSCLLLLTALLGMTGTNAWAQTTYEISNADELAAFAEVVNGGETTANAVLTADIDMSTLSSWTAIGDWNTGAVTSAYCGHFDGQGHTIKKFNFTSTHNYYGIFGVVSTGCLIENLTVEGEITTNIATAGVVGYARDATPTLRNIHSYLNINNTRAGSRLGGILGSSVNGTIVVDRCTYSGTLDGNDAGGSGNYGGIVGYVNNNSAAHLRVTNCLFDGELKNTAATPGSCTFGGMVGYVGANPDVIIENCLSIGTVQSQIYGQFYGAVKHNTCSIINSFYQGDKVNGAANGAVTPTIQEATEVTDAQLASGEIAFLLNGDQSTINWFQVLSRIFIAQDYVVTVNGTPRDPEHTEVSLTEEGSGKYTFTLPNFVIHTNNIDLAVGDIILEGVTINNDGTFSKAGTFSVPDENIPTYLISYKDKFKDINYTINGKVNNEDKLFVTLEGISIDMSLMGTFNVSVEVGTDDFTAAAPLAAEPYPTPYGTSVVYANGEFYCDMRPKGDVTYSNTDGSIVDNHVFEYGFCTVCGALKENYMTANADGFFEIGTAAQLKWFAAYVNKVNPAVNAILTADIALTEAWTAPIGTNATPYTGTFDGQGKAITGFSQTATTTHNGLFGNINGATVQNFSISGSLTSDKDYCGVIGLSKGSSKVKGIHSSLNLDIQFKGWAGGVVGGADGYIVIEECSFDGTLNTHNFEDSKGGILGYANAATIKNCLFSGTIVGEGKQHYGGILGYVNNGAFGGVQNCLSIGSVTTTNTSHNGVAAIVGNMNSSTKVDGIFNNYWLTGSSYAGNNGAKAPDAEAPVEVTAEQLASGEVTAKLGIAFRQNIGTDATPVLDPTHNVVAEITAAGYATLYVPDTDVTIPAGVTAYTGEFATNPNNGIQHLAMTEVNGGVLPAQTAVVLKGAEGIYEFAVSVPVPDGALGVYDDEVNGENALVKGWAAPIAGNVLKGTADDIEAAGKYVLAQPAGEPVCFYLAESGIIKAGKAYLEVPAGTDVKAFYFSFGDDDATGLSDMSDMSDHSDIIFNLAGQRIQKMQKGVNIVGGKKILF